jgi:hypothetical protein
MLSYIVVLTEIGNKEIQVKVLTKAIYVNANHDMCQLLLGHHQVYLCALRC